MCIRDSLRRTLLLPPSRTEVGVWPKCEFLQHTGVFKARGAFNLLLAARERGELDPQAGVVIASGGNAGLATAYAAGVLRVPATVFVPSIASAVKVARLRDYGADVHVVGTEYSHAASAAADFARVRGALASHAYDLPEVVAGAVSYTHLDVYKRQHRTPGRGLADDLHRPGARGHDPVGDVVRPDAGLGQPRRARVPPDQRLARARGRAEDPRRVVRLLSLIHI